MFAAVFENLGEPAHLARVRFITTALRQKGELTLGVPLLGSRRTMCLALAKLRASPTKKRCRGRESFPAFDITNRTRADRKDFCPPSALREHLG